MGLMDVGVHPIDDITPHPTLHTSTHPLIINPLDPSLSLQPPREGPHEPERPRLLPCGPVEFVGGVAHAGGDAAAVAMLVLLLALVIGGIGGGGGRGGVELGLSFFGKCPRACV